jgi:hypothetical protein
MRLLAKTLFSEPVKNDYVQSAGQCDFRSGKGLRVDAVC